MQKRIGTPSHNQRRTAARKPLQCECGDAATQEEDGRLPKKNKNIPHGRGRGRRRRNKKEVPPVSFNVSEA